MPAGGTIFVSARACAGNVKIVVRDEGEGIAPEIFGPISSRVSTKARGGLGLHIVETIVKQDHGEVRAANCVNSPGAEFIITIPPWKAA